MKTKQNIYASLLLMLFCIGFASGQEECKYDSTDITLTLNGWDFDRTDYTHEKFVEVAGLDNSNELDYSGEKDTEEFGYPWYYYYLGNNYIHFAGVQDSVGLFNGEKRINSFVIVERGVFNVNGIQVGDSADSIESAFDGVDFCSETNSLGQENIYFWYEYFALTFFLSSNNYIEKIELYAPI